MPLLPALPPLPAPPPLPALPPALDDEPAAPEFDDPPLPEAPTPAPTGPLPPELLTLSSNVDSSSGCGFRQAMPQQAKMAHGNARQRARREKRGSGTKSSTCWIARALPRGTPGPSSTQIVPYLAQR